MDEIVRLTDEDIVFLQKKYPTLNYDVEKNIIVGDFVFDAQYKDEDNNVLLEAVADRYQIEINLNKVTYGVPIVREIGDRILNIAKHKNINYAELHLNNSNGEMCTIIPPKAKEKFPNGFDLKRFLEHLEEHLYWVSYVEKYNKEPWKAHGHGDMGYLELFLEDKSKYLGDFKKYFKCNSRLEVRKKVRILRKKYKI